ncbi:hypothetical protein MtrunA17_Chr1g0172921 [Medicago truncatula]|uniref:Uncharacterized protein n=1 Tax=Medicago truncatula TaxID=3880 RepID=A0A396JNU8_MEDTR|nr:hypothetical protein MtrunA17_Chr1g0172921 [Medicago truncatula]
MDLKRRKVLFRKNDMTGFCKTQYMPIPKVAVVEVNPKNKANTKGIRFIVVHAVFWDIINRLVKV